MLHPNKVSYKMSTVSSRREDQTEWDDWPSALKCQGYGKQEVANTSHPCLTLSAVGVAYIKGRVKTSRIEMTACKTSEFF